MSAEGERSLRVKQVTTGSEVTVVRHNWVLWHWSHLHPRCQLSVLHARRSGERNNINLYAVPSLGGASGRSQAMLQHGSILADGKRWRTGARLKTKRTISCWWQTRMQ